MTTTVSSDTFTSGGLWVSGGIIMGVVSGVFVTVIVWVLVEVVRKKRNKRVNNTINCHNRYVFRWHVYILSSCQNM